MRESEERRRKAAMRLHSEKRTCPGREKPKATEGMLSYGQSERGGKVFWDTEQLESDPTSRWGSRIASQPFLPTEAIMGTLGTGQRRRCDSSESAEARWLVLHLQPLVSHRRHARRGVGAPSHARGEAQHLRLGVEQQAHLTWLFGGAALPLTLLPQRAGAATADAGCIHHAQAPIGFSALLVDTQVLPGRTTQRAIWLRGKVASRETASFPGQGLYGRSIALCRGRREVDRCSEGKAEQIRSCAPGSAQADGPTAGARSIPMEICTSLMAKQAESGLMRCGKFLQRIQRGKQNTRGVAASENTGCGVLLQKCWCYGKLCLYSRTPEEFFHKSAEPVQMASL